MRFQTENSYLPTVPVNLQADYDGWFEEALKRIRLRSVHRTREEQLKLARQADELGRIYHSIVETEQNVQETILAGAKRRGELVDDIKLRPLEKEAATPVATRYCRFGDETSCDPEPRASGDAAGRCRSDPARG